MKSLLRFLGFPLGLVWFVAVFLDVAGNPAATASEPNSQPQRPNILWITCEDMGPHLGCFGDEYSESPQLDRFAARSVRYTSVWSNAPVCAPARTTLISGMSPTSTGSEHMRSQTRLPKGMRFFPQFLRESGYYCTNNSKEDYNLEKPEGVWDDSSNKANYRNRKADQPFFAVYNLTVTHESQIRTRPHQLRHDPAKVRIPKYHPDTSEVRHDWAQYYDNITTMDAQAGKILTEVDEQGLADSTIVWFFSDHGSGMPRNKRWPYNCGLHVPLILHFPDRFRELAPDGYKPGSAVDRLVSFVDFAPTVLSLAGIQPPETMQGNAFLGRFAVSPREYLHGFRGRMDERYDMVRSVRDARYVYVRNYLPHLIYGQHLDYMFQTPTTVAWKRLFDRGMLSPEQAAFWKPKPPEELYDLESDPEEVLNLVNSPEHQEILARLRTEQERQVVRVRDIGLLPEHEIHARSTDSTPYEYGQSDKYPLERIAAVAHQASSLRDRDLPALVQAFADPDSAVRYWAVLGIRMRGPETVLQHQSLLRKALSDAAPSVQIVAAEALSRYGDKDDVAESTKTLLRHSRWNEGSVFLALAALNAIDSLGLRTPEVLNAVREIPKSLPAKSSRSGYGIERLTKRILTAEAP